MRILTVLSVTALLAAPVPGAAQQDERFRPPAGQTEAIIYRDRNFSGPAVAIQQAQADLRSDIGLSWQVRALRIKSGQWELCTGRNFTGTCRIYTSDMADLGTQFSVRSIRPAGNWGGGGPVPPRPPSASLRGMSAEFFPAPTTNGQRVQSCATGGSTANCTARTADNYCRSVGWNGAAYQSQQSEGRRVYLVDVLCVSSGY